MGVNLFKKNSFSSYESPKSINPNPSKYIIIKVQQLSNLIILKVQYIDCTNFEGNKILVYENVSLEELMNTRTIDPHFFDGTGILSPIARFAPTDKGWKMAEVFCRAWISANTSTNYR